MKAVKIFVVMISVVLCSASLHAESFFSDFGKQKGTDIKGMFDLKSYYDSLGDIPAQEKAELLKKEFIRRKYATHRWQAWTDLFVSTIVITAAVVVTAYGVYQLPDLYTSFSKFLKENGKLPDSLAALKKYILNEKDLPPSKESVFESITKANDNHDASVIEKATQKVLRYQDGKLILDVSYMGSEVEVDKVDEGPSFFEYITKTVQKSNEKKGAGLQTASFEIAKDQLKFLKELDLTKDIKVAINNSKNGVSSYFNTFTQAMSGIFFQPSAYEIGASGSNKRMSVDEIISDGEPNAFEKVVQEGSSALFSKGVEMFVAYNLAANPTQTAAAMSTVLLSSVAVANAAASAGRAFVNTISSGLSYIAKQPSTAMQSYNTIRSYEPVTNLDLYEINYIKQKYLMDPKVADLIEGHFVISEVDADHFEKIKWVIDLALKLPLASKDLESPDIADFQHLFRNYSPSLQRQIKIYLIDQLVRSSVESSLAKEGKKMKPIRLYFTGAAGTGKTEAVLRLAALLKTSVARIDMRNMEYNDLFGTSLNSTDPRPGRLVDALLEAGNQYSDGQDISKNTQMTLLIENFDSLAYDSNSSSAFSDLINKDSNGFYSPFFNAKIPLPQTIIFVSRKADPALSRKLFPITFIGYNLEQKRKIVLEEIIPNYMSKNSMLPDKSSDDSNYLPKKTEIQILNAIEKFDEDPGINELEIEVTNILRKAFFEGADEGADNTDHERYIDSD